MSTSPAALIERLGLQPHPEGGYYVQTFQSPEKFQTGRGTRAASTAIYFLVPQSTFSALHRIKSDEVWHFYGGKPLRIIVITADGKREDQVIGNDILNGQLPQFVVPAGAWFGAVLEGDEGLEEGDYALVGCTVAPGFDFEDFELASCRELTGMFPEHAEVIGKMTRQ